MPDRRQAFHTACCILYNGGTEDEMDEKRYVTEAGSDPKENGRKLAELLEQCRQNGGGTVEVTEGIYAVASLRLYSRMCLYLRAGAKLVASDRWEDYTDYHVPSTIEYIHSGRVVRMWNLPEHYFNAVITAIEADHVSVIGEPGSLINGNNCFDPNGEEKFRGPMGMVFCRCSDVHLEGYTFQDSSNWSHQLDSCTNVEIANVTVLAGHDGFNVHHCENVRIRDCTLTTGDDCFAGYDARNVYISGSHLNTSCNGFRYGGENLIVDHCVFEGPGVYPHRVSGRHNMLYAFEYYSIQEDTIRDVSRNWLITNCEFRNMDGFIHYDFGDWKESQTNQPLADITVENFRISGLKKTSLFRGCTQMDSHITSRITFRDGTIDLAGMEHPVFLETDAAVRLEAENVTVTGGRLTEETKKE